ncbi:hypothetical protein Q4Q34_17725 [Flavivirga abyssicola]|uniref:hypothetical protein n=1 Tax=Flavivirga abyssicola TaxID=3063533 RepID=UPI0026DEA278|nr:hypothetical protein [Flavivirga sp. MEBiC07777]WVK13057.1 hypothetical protein Q4Q34_17725 [Flavivirga sp. MEBiC07777]
MRVTIFFIFLATYTISYGQKNDKISTIDFVQILNDNKEEAVYYYQNNWKVLRNMAIDKKYIHSFQILETQANEDAPFHLMLITTYLNEAQYKLREDHFSELIKEKGELKLLNDKKPGAFRKTLFSKERTLHWK